MFLPNLLALFSILVINGVVTAPPYDAKTATVIKTIVGDNKPTVAISKQIYQVNDDGSYTFGYEAADGAFRVENRDAKGYVIGRYGYVDSNGKLQVVEYVAGKGETGKSIGFQPKGDMIIAAPVRSISKIATSPEQKALDLLYSSLDENEDGIPDDLQSGVKIAEKQVPVYQSSATIKIAEKQAPVYQPFATIKSPVVVSIRQPEIIQAQYDQPTKTIFRSTSSGIVDTPIVSKESYNVSPSAVIAASGTQESSAPAVASDQADSIVIQSPLFFGTRII